MDDDDNQRPATHWNASMAISFLYKHFILIDYFRWLNMMSSDLEIIADGCAQCAQIGSGRVLNGVPVALAHSCMKVAGNINIRYKKIYGVHMHYFPYLSILSSKVGTELSANLSAACKSCCGSTSALVTGLFFKLLRPRIARQRGSDAWAASSKAPEAATKTGLVLKLSSLLTLNK